MSAPANEEDATLKEAAYERIIRDATQAYLSDGTPAVCPKCGSRDVGSGEEFYEFTTMHCGACGFEELADDWQLADWYPLTDESPKGGD